jgi:hypothetical protein
MKTTIEKLEESGIIDKNLSIGAEHSKLQGLLNSISIASSDNPLVEVEYKGKQSNIILPLKVQEPWGETILFHVISAFPFLSKNIISSIWSPVHTTFPNN